MKTWKDKLTFGKYKGKTIEKVYILDQGWLNWAIKNVNFFKPDADVEMAIRLVKPMKKERYGKQEEPLSEREYTDEGCPF